MGIRDAVLSDVDVVDVQTLWRALEVVGGGDNGDRSAIDGHLRLGVVVTVVGPQLVVVVVLLKGATCVVRVKTD